MARKLPPSALRGRCHGNDVNQSCFVVTLEDCWHANWSFTKPCPPWKINIFWTFDKSRILIFNQQIQSVLMAEMKLADFNWFLLCLQLSLMDWEQNMHLMATYAACYCANWLTCNYARRLRLKLHAPGQMWAVWNVKGKPPCFFRIQKVTITAGPCTPL